MIKKILLLIFLATSLLLTSCAKDPYDSLKEERPPYDFLSTSASVHPQNTMRQQRNLAFNNAKYRLKTNVKDELDFFMNNYLAYIGVTNEKLIEKMREYVYMDMQSVFEAVEQTDVRILDKKIMEISVRLNKALFVSALKEALTLNFKRDRTVWERFQEQSAQDHLKLAIEVLVSAIP